VTTAETVLGQLIENKEKRM